MTTQLEQDLRDLFLADAREAPDATRVVERTLRKAAHRPRRAPLLAAAAAAVVLVAGGAAVVRLGTAPDDPADAGRSPTPVSPSATADLRGALWADGQESCVEEYGPAAVADRDFAFDGTVTAIGPSITDRGDEADLGYAGVTFEVHEWFGGGSGPTVTVDLGPPGGDPSLAVGDELGPAYAIGTRLLVSGAHRWGLDSADDLIAWGCGFSRYYDDRTAAAWRAATGG